MATLAASVSTDRRRRSRARSAVDLLLLGFFFVLFVTREGPDYLVHSVVGLVLPVVVAVHLASKRSWMARAWTRAGWTRKTRNSRINAALAATALVCVVTGVPAWLGYASWNVPHAVTGFASVALALAHLVRNRSKLVGLLRASSLRARP